MYKERIQNLMQHCKENPNHQLLVEEQVNKIVDYVSYATFMDTLQDRLTSLEVQIRQMGIQGIFNEQWEDEVAKLNGNCQSKQDEALSAVDQLNHLSAGYGLPPFYNGIINHEHRTDISNECRQVCDEYFKGHSPHPLTSREMTGEQEASEFASSIAELSEENKSELAL